MTLQELIMQFHRRILVSKDKKVTTAKIIKEIDALKYSSNNQPISVEDKKRILIALQQEILNETFLVHSQDNKEHLELISQAIKMLGGK